MDKELYFNESADKQMLISVDGTKIAFDNSMIESEAFEMDESLCSESELKFGTCEANSVKFTVHDTPGSMDEPMEQIYAALIDGRDDETVDWIYDLL